MLCHDRALFVCWMCCVTYLSSFAFLVNEIVSTESNCPKHKFILEFYSVFVVPTKGLYLIATVMIVLVLFLRMNGAEDAVVQFSNSE